MRSSPLPPELRQTLAERIDRRVAVFVGGSIVLHAAIAIAAWLGDPPASLLAAPVAATTYQQEVIDILVPDAPPAVSEPGAAMPAPAQTPHRIVEPTRIKTRPAEPVDTQRLAAILTGGQGEVGKSGMNPRQPGADLDKQIADARDSNATIGDDTHTSRVDDSAHAIERDPQPGPPGPTFDRVIGEHRDAPLPRIVASDVHSDSDDWRTLSPMTVLERIRHVYIAGLQRCYRFGLAADATLSGRVEISLTVDERGHVSDADASGVSAEVDSCIAKQMQSWRFPAPKAKDGKATDATFTVSLALQPS
jgi:outer membrane biosynthesis protein TonB